MLNKTNSLGLVICLAAFSILLGGCTKPETPTAGEPTAKDTAGLPPAQPAKPAVVYYDELYVDAEAEPDEGEPPLNVQFTSIVEDNTGAVECEWDFGDGISCEYPAPTGAPPGSPSVCDSSSPSHVYGAVGPCPCTHLPPPSIHSVSTSLWRVR